MSKNPKPSDGRRKPTLERGDTVMLSAGQQVVHSGQSKVSAKSSLKRMPTDLEIEAF